MDTIAEATSLSSMEQKSRDDRRAESITMHLQACIFAELIVMPGILHELHRERRRSKWI